MANNVAVRRYRACYAMLLRLYPKSFYDRFGKQMLQTYDDLCRERQNTRQELFMFALWILFETSLEIIRENTTHMTQLRKTILQVALVALGLLMVPLIASQVVEGWNWNAGAFVLVYVLFFVTGMVYAVIARKMGVWSYKLGVGMALVVGFALAWSNMVHVADSGNPANLMYYSVLIVGVIGACIVRLKARGLARTLFVMAVVLALIAVVLPSGAPPTMARNMAIGHGVFVVLLTVSGLLFRHASLEEVR